MPPSTLSRCSTGICGVGTVGSWAPPSTRTGGLAGPGECGGQIFDERHSCHLVLPDHSSLVASGLVMAGRAQVALRLRLASLAVIERLPSDPATCGNDGKQTLAVFICSSIVNYKDGHIDARALQTLPK